MNTETLPQTGTIAYIEVGALKTNPWNRTRDLDEAFVESVRVNGVLCALTVRTLDADDGTYQIIAGVRYEMEREGSRAADIADVKFAAWMVDADFPSMVKEAEAELEQGPAAEDQAGDEDGAEDEDDEEG